MSKDTTILLFMILPAVANAACLAPNQTFIADRIKQSFMGNAGEQELKEIVRHHKNYELREQVRNNNRRLTYIDRLERQGVVSDSEQNFQKMIEGSGRGDGIITDFPMKGSNSKVEASQDSLSIQMNNLSKEDLEFLTPGVLEKLGNNVRIHYMYPYDKFEYYLTYNGKELPMKRALHKIQDDFEESCVLNRIESRRSRDADERDRNSNSRGGVNKN